MPRPLSGITVLDCSTFLAGPFACGILGEFGADIVKIEQPKGGDPFRRYGTPAEGGDTLAFRSENRNRASLTLDLRQERGAAIFKRLAAGADVVVENFRPGTLARWGLGYPELAAANPRLVMLHVSGYGQTGPYRDRPGFARIAHAFGGLTHLAGMPDGPPLTPGSTSLADYMSGLYGALGVLLALRERDASGQGQEIDIALYEPVFRVLDELAPAYAQAGTVRGREGLGTLNACPHGHFECGDGSWVAIACTSDKMWQRLAEAMGRPELAARYPTARDRIAARDEVDGAVATWTKSQPRPSVIERCVAGEVPCGPVNTIADIFADPHFRARGNLADVAATIVPGVVPILSRTPGAIDRLGPALGADTTTILGERLGLSPAEIEALRRDGIV